ncbi:diaminopimelate decarboxylase [Fibrella aquatilis]|uniref:Diaminopimelate decarboxylase n=1 Tax=Fibrella aquatilis TaxID=2817059 RepID=A0A939G0U2_9BACT|nr:diaminopimelate decarboxylase [Fibrella aquatilis]MBO0929776.1 diaminopimelate decarboxylase [Fibrella aquatilis]
MPAPYQLQGIPTTTIADEFGLPLYVYDADKIIDQINRFRAAFSGSPGREINLRIKYATKALTNLSILKLMRMQGVEVDVVSVNEARLALLAGYTPEQIMYTPSGNAWPEIQEAIQMGLRLNVDSLPLLEQVGNTYGHTVPVCLRINPSVADGGNLKIQTGHADSKFGIPHALRADIARMVVHYGIVVEGLHVHTGSDFKSARTFLQGAEVLFDLAGDYPDLKFIDFGSGFKVAYREGDHVTDMAELGTAITDAFSAFCDRYGRALELWFEPGKFLVSEAGHLLVGVNVVKQHPTRTFVQVDSGLNHLIRPMMYDAYHEIVNLSNPMGTPTTYDVVGYICETDTFATNRDLPEVRPGDVLSIENAGAYGFSMASTYNLRPRPAEVLVYEGTPHLIRQRDTFEDLTRGMVDVAMLNEELIIKN